MERYPYFIYPVIRELRQCEAAGEDDSPKVRRLKEIIATNVGDYKTLVALVGDMGDCLEAYMSGKNKEEISEEASIDSFIAKFGGGEEIATEYPFLQGEEVLQEEASEEKEEDDIENIEEIEDDIDYIDEFEDEEDEIEEVFDEDPEEEEENFDNLFEKAKSFVKKGDYHRALGIMETIYLNNPKKSVYFADQIRFVKKMMINDGKK